MRDIFPDLHLISSSCHLDSAVLCVLLCSKLMFFSEMAALAKIYDYKVEDFKALVDAGEDEGGDGGDGVEELADGGSGGTPPSACLWEDCYAKALQLEVFPRNSTDWAVNDQKGVVFVKRDGNGGFL